MKNYHNKLLLASSLMALAAPSLAVCSIDDGNTEKGAGKPLVDCWIYPEDGGEGKIVKLKEGAKAPKGYAFQPAPLSEVTEAVTEEGSEAENAKLRSVEADRDKLNDELEEAKKTIGIQETQIKKLQSDVETLTAEKAPLAESAQALQDENDEMKAAAKAAETTIEAQANEIAELKKPATKGADAANDNKPEGGSKEK